MLANQKQVDELEARFRDCYESNYRSLRRYVARLADDPEEARDLTQEVFARLWKEMEQGGQITNPRAWIYRVASNLVINRAKSRSRAWRHEKEEAKQTALRLAPNDLERSTIQREIVGRALRSLPAPMRQCLLLYHEGLMGREIAAVLGVKPSYVGTLVLRAHERFRRECEAMGGDSDLLR